MAAAVGGDEDGRIGSHGESFFMMWSRGLGARCARCLNSARCSGNLAKIRQAGKILAIWQHSGNLAKFWQSGKILAIWQHSGNLAKFWQSGKN
jgi:hypothetical protein